MNKPPIRRRVKRVDNSGQFALLMPAGTTTERSIPVQKQVVFVDPDPRQLQVGGMGLVDHLKQCGIRHVFVIRSLLEAQDWTTFESAYKAGGRRPYSPRAMMGLILYGVMQGRSSLRQLEQLACVDLGCWWLTGGIMPDHSMIGRFIQQHTTLLTDTFFDSLTRSVLKVTGSDVSRTAGDGTVVEAACSRYGSLKREALEKRIDKARQHLSTVQKAESETHDDFDAVKAQSNLDQLLDAEIELAKRAAKRKTKGRNPSATRINPDETEAVNQPLKRQGYGTAYKPSVLANNRRIIVAHAVDPSSETVVVPSLLSSAQRQGELKESSWDAGYHSHGVLKLEVSHEVNLLIPEGHSYTTAPDWNKHSDKLYLKSRFQYDKATDTYICPADALLSKVGSYKGNADNAAYTEYGTAACKDCPQRTACTKSKKGRRIKRYVGDSRKETMREKFKDEAVRQRYQQRAGWVEPVFSQLKERQGLSRFRRTGLAAVRLEFALHALAYNLGRAVAFFFGWFGWIRHLKWLKSVIEILEKAKITTGEKRDSNFTQTLQRWCWSPPDTFYNSLLTGGGK